MAPQPEDSNLDKLKQDRPWFGDGQPASAYLRVPRRLAKLGRHDEAIEQIVDLLRLDYLLAEREFAHCSKTERRGMLAMWRHQLYGGLAHCQAPDRRGTAVYCRLVAHAWWCLGLRLQLRKEELARSIQADEWQRALSKPERADVAMKACARFAARDESDIDALRSQLIEALGIEAPRGY